MFPPSCTSVLTPTSSHPSRLSQSTSLSSMSHWLLKLAVLHMAVYMFPWYSLHSSHLSFPTLCPQICSLCLHLHCCPQNRFISRTYLDSMLCFLLSCPTLCDPMDCSLPGSLSIGILQARIMERVALPSSRGSS